jgi:DNA-binding MarR family transcriptional regulator
MRYEKGSISINSARDVPLLQQVLRSSFITGSQLFEFLRLGNIERSERAFHHRLQRLIKHGLVEKQKVLIHERGPIYTVTTAGLSLLSDLGELYAGRTGIESANDGFLHWLEINDLHLALLRARVLAQWIPSSEICSQNDLTTFRYAKDYDAVVTVRWKGSEFRFALEYERTAKTPSRYLGICDALESDMHVNVILYAASNYHLMCFLRDNLQLRNKTVCVGLMSELRDQSLTARVMVGGTARPPAPFHDILMSCAGARNASQIR